MTLYKDHEIRDYQNRDRSRGHRLRRAKAPISRRPISLLFLNHALSGGAGGFAGFILIARFSD